MASTTTENTTQPITTKPAEQLTTSAADVQPPTEEADKVAETTDRHEESTGETEYATEEERSSSVSGDYQTYGYSEREIDLIARTTYLESGGCGEYCQWLTASTIVNLADRNGGMESVVYNYNMFSVAGLIDSCSPSELSYSIALRVASGDRDSNVIAFREGYYHSFGTPYTNVDNVYFSTF